LIDSIKDFFNKKISGEALETGPETDKRIQVAASALLVEMARIDNEFSEEEGERIISLLKKEFGLTDEVTLELVEMAELELKAAVDIWQFTSLINSSYTPAEKIRLIELVWRVVYADGKLDKHEDYLVKKIANLLNLRHQEMIDAKLRVMGRA
jgi:uncharacterized tellurite resistance protein B-like protein